MMNSASHNVTQLLIAWGHGDEAAGDQLIPLVYGQLRRIARHRLRGEFASQTLKEASPFFSNVTNPRLTTQINLQLATEAARGRNWGRAEPFFNRTWVLDKLSD